MKFMLWLDPDIDTDDPRALLAWALDSIESNPELRWTIVDDDGTVIADGVSLVDA